MSSTLDSVFEELDESKEKEKTEKLPLSEILIGQDFTCDCGGSSVVEHRPSKPMVTNHKSKSRRTKPALDNRSK